MSLTVLVGSEENNEPSKCYVTLWSVATRRDSYPSSIIRKVRADDEATGPFASGWMFLALLNVHSRVYTREKRRSGRSDQIKKRGSEKEEGRFRKTCEYTLK